MLSTGTALGSGLGVYNKSPKQQRPNRKENTVAEPFLSEIRIMFPLKGILGMVCWRSRPLCSGAERGEVRLAIRVRAVAPNVVQRHHPYSPECVDGGIPLARE